MAANSILRRPTVSSPMTCSCMRTPNWRAHVYRMQLDWKQGHPRCKKEGITPTQPDPTQHHNIEYNSKLKKAGQREQT